MKFSYGDILKQAFRIQKTHKFFWILGLFLVSPLIINLSANESWKVNPPPSPIVSLAWLLLAVVLIILSFRAAAAIILTVKKTTDQQPVLFKQIFAESRLFYWKLFLIEFLIGLGVMVLGVVLITPVMYLVSANNLQGAWVVGSIAGLIGAVVAVVCFLVEALAPSSVVIFNLKIRDALDQSFALVRQRLLTLLGFGLILLLVQVMPVVIWWVLAYYIDGLAAQIALFAALFLLLIVLTTFQQIAWVLAFLELVKPEKISEEELAEIPEPAVE